MLLKKIGQRGWSSWWRVCYQRGLPRLVNIWLGLPAGVHISLQSCCVQHLMEGETVELYIIYDLVFPLVVICSFSLPIVNNWWRLRQSCKKRVLRVLQNLIFSQFSAKFVQFSAKLLSLDMSIRDNLENIIFTACKWHKLCKYYVNSMVISYIICQKEEKECTWVKYVIYAVLPRLKFCRNLRNFSEKS